MSILLADIDATCAALGYTDGQKYQAEPDAIQGLKHLIWILRRDLDNHEYRRHLGRSKVLQTDLVYMLPDYIADEEFADVLIRLLVILTNPTLLLYRDGPPKDNHGRKIYMELVDILQGYKSAFTRDKIWTALFGKLQKSLEIDWALRSEEQSLLIERILVLIRNVLQVPANPELECRADNDASVHDQVIWALHQSGMLDLVLFVISSPDEHQFHLHGLEILCLLYREQTAESLADASLQRSAAEKQRDEQELIAARRREKQRLVSRPPPARHSRFGGTYVIRNLKSVSDRDIICHQPLERAVALDFDREKEQQKRSHRHVKEEGQGTRRSAFSVRLCLREYCIEVLRSAYNTLVRQVRRVLERNSGSAGHDDSYLLWAIRFFMEFNRLSGLQLHLVSESLSVQCFHWVLTRMQHDMDMIVSDKKQARLWAKRLHVALQTFRELLQSLLALQKLQDEKARALFDMLLNNVCYVLEYRETILHLLMNYNEAHSTKVYLRDVVETANVFIKMMEKFCKDSVVVQDKRRTKQRSGKKAKKPEKTPAETEEELANRWAEMAADVTELLTNELQLPEEDQPLPFDATAEKSIDDQREDCMIRIHKFLRESKLEQAVALLRSAREVWPENDVFGAFTAAPEDELLLLREIFLHNITTVETPPEEDATLQDYDEEDEENEELEDNGMVEKTFKFEDFAKRLLNPKIVRACVVVLADWEQIPTKSLKAAVTILHRIAYGCSCPAMLYQATLFRIFQHVLGAPRDAHHEELRRLGIYVVRKFVETAPSNPKIYAELLFYKTVKEANELESGYCDAYESGTKGAWTEEQETELRFLFEENQRNPETDKDVIDWILENLIDKKRTRRGVLKKLKELGLHFKAPTKKSTAGAANRHLWRSEEDEELRSLYDQHRLESDCLQRILDEFAERRSKQQILKRMLQLHMIADKSEVLPPRQRKRKSKKHGGDNDDDDDRDEARSDDDAMEEPGQKSAARKDGGSRTKKPKPKPQPKPKKRKVVRTPLDVGTVRALIEQVDTERFQAAVDWLQECLVDAAEDTDAPGEEDDGVPLLPLLEAQKDAMEDAEFRKVLVALGMQPPIVGMESYWRIPTYLNAADLQLRAKILAGEAVEVDVAGIEEDDDDQDEDGGDGDQGADSGQDEDNEEEAEEEDVFDGFLQRRREQLNSLMFSKSDDEDEQRRPAKAKAKKQRERPGKREGGRRSRKDDSSEDDVDVDEIKRKLDKKKKKRSQGQDSAESASDSESAEATKKPGTETGSAPSPTTAEILFDQLKAKRSAAKSRQAADVPATQDSEGLDFNSEDYRQRLAELGDSDNDADEGPKTLAEDGTSDNDRSAKNRSRRRANVIDSDSEGEDRMEDGDGVAATANERGTKGPVVMVEEEEEDGGEGDEYGAAAGKTSNQAIVGATATANSENSNKNKKRRRSDDELSDGPGDDVADVNNDVNSDEDALFIKRRKPSKEEQLRSATGEEPAKRRRVAVIDDEDDD